MRTLPGFPSKGRWIYPLFILGFLFSFSVLLGQTQHIPIGAPSDDPTDPTNGYSSFSPSITNYTLSGVERQVVAYVYPYSANGETRPSHYKVGFRYSTDGGQTWDVLNAALPFVGKGSTNSGATLSNYDEPQLQYIGNGKLICVVRGWADESQLGNPSGRQSHSIYQESGIYLFLSTDNGTHWGKYQSGTFVEKPVIIDETSLSSTISTVEYPRITFRKGFDTKGYIVWNKKTWSNPSTGIYRLSDSKIGLKAFSVSPNADDEFNDGKLYTTSSPYLSYNNSSIKAERASVSMSPDKGIWISFYTADYGDPSSGDNYRVKTFTNSITNGSGLAKYPNMGSVFPKAKWYLVKYSCSISSSNASFTRVGNEAQINPTPNSTANPPQSDHPILGNYDATRGYTYLVHFNDPRTILTSQAIFGLHLVDFAQGPSVQVSVENPLNCNSYTVGVAYVRGNINEIEQTNSMKSWISFYSAPIDSGGDASVWNARKKQDPDGLAVDADEPVISGVTYETFRFFPCLKYTNVSVANDFLTTKPIDNSTTTIPRSFLTLSFMHSAKKTGLKNAGDINQFELWWPSCKSAVSFDGVKFTVPRINGLSGTTPLTTNVDFVRPSEDVTTFSSNMLNGELWGKQLDCAGEFGNFQIHPVWHLCRITANTLHFKAEDIVTNKGGCIFATPYVENYPGNDPEGFPTIASNGAGIIDVGGVASISVNASGSGYSSIPAQAPIVTFSSGTASAKAVVVSGAITRIDVVNEGLAYTSAPTITITVPSGAPGSGATATAYLGATWSPYAYFEFSNPSSSTFDLIDHPKGLTTSDQIGLGITTGIPHSVKRLYDNAQTTNNCTFNNILSLIKKAGIGTVDVPTGLYYANYTHHGDRNFGVLGSSNQRKVVSTGDFSHTVFTDNNDNLVYYSEVGVSTYTGSKKWIRRVALNENAGATLILQKKPSIAVYQRGNGTDLCGEAAIAATWLEIHRVPGSGNENLFEVRIMMRTREFNMCNGYWPNWSEPYLISSFQFDHVNVPSTYDYLIHEDYTVPVIAPLVGAPQGSGAIKNCYLLGWTVTWTSPQLLFSDGKGQFDLSGSCAYKIRCGVYSRTWLRTNGAGTTIRTQNENWGIDYPTTTSGAPSQIALRPVSGTNPPWNILRSGVSECNNKDEYPIDFPSVVSTESKANDDIYQDIVYSSNSDIFSRNNKIWEIKAVYTNTGSSSSLGSLSSVSNAQQISQLPIGPSPDGSITQNPCITINSHGQRFASWQQIDKIFRIVSDKARVFQGYQSSIKIGRTDLTTGGWTNRNGLRDITSVFATANNLPTVYFAGVNPSITAFPKSHLLEHTTSGSGDDPSDFDPAAVELAFTWYYFPTSVNLGSLTRIATYHEDRNDISATTGKWRPWSFYQVSPTWGIYPQRSFGMYEGGPSYSGSYIKAESIKGNENGLNAKLGMSWVTANSIDPISRTIATSPYNILSELGGLYSYKGTYDSTVGVEFYSSESRVKYGGQIDFTWGGVYVGDTSSSLPLRKVVLHYGQRDSGYTTFDEMRDSIFRTEVFDWPSGSEISMYRGITLHDSSSAFFNALVSDTSVNMRYNIELVGSDTSMVIPIEQLLFSPAKDSNGIPGIVHITNNTSTTLSVYLRVRGEMTGLSNDADSGSFSVIQADTAYQSFMDTSFAIYKISALNTGNDSKILVYPPYPNPVLGVSQGFINQSFMTDKGHSVTLKLFNMLGQELSSQVVMSSGILQNIRLKIPEVSGAYIIQIQSGNEVHSVPVTVIN